jgi:hypothetical protein
VKCELMKKRVRLGEGVLIDVKRVLRGWLGLIMALGRSRDDDDGRH